MANSSEMVTICGERLSRPLHICAFFDSQEQQYEVLVPYFKEGLANNEEVITILETGSHAEHYGKLCSCGLDVDKSLESGQLKMYSSDQTYLRDGYFAAERMYKLLEDALSSTQSGPYNAMRTCGDMQWALRNLPGTDELMEYEARINLLLPKYNCTLLCFYDINRFSGPALADVLATHSHVIMNGKIHKNPQYVDPLRYMQYLLNRPKRKLYNL